jgi:hypothetical protein
MSQALLLLLDVLIIFEELILPGGWPLIFFLMLNYLIDVGKFLFSKDLLVCAFGFAGPIAVRIFIDPRSW